MDKTIADLVKRLTKERNIPVKDLSEALGCTQQSYRNKLTRNSFSIKDLLIVLSLCGMSLGVIDNIKDVDPLILTLKDYLTEEELESYKKVKLAQIQKSVDEINKLLSTLPEDEKNNIIDNIIERK